MVRSGEVYIVYTSIYFSACKWLERENGKWIVKLKWMKISSDYVDGKRYRKHNNLNPFEISIPESKQTGKRIKKWNL